MYVNMLLVVCKMDFPRHKKFSEWTKEEKDGLKGFEAYKRRQSLRIKRMISEHKYFVTDWKTVALETPFVERRVPDCLRRWSSKRREYGWSFIRSNPSSIDGVDADTREPWVIEIEAKFEELALPEVFKTSFVTGHCLRGEVHAWWVRVRSRPVRRGDYFILWEEFKLRLREVFFAVKQGYTFIEDAAYLV